MTQAFNLSQLANNLNSSGQLDATDGLVNAVPVANGGTGASTAAAARTNLGAATGTMTDWAFVQSGSSLLMQYSGVTKATLDSSGNLTITGNIDAGSTLTFGNFSVEESSGTLLFKYLGVSIFSIASTGEIVSTDNVSAYGTI